MPDLPTYTVSQMQADRILAAFGSAQTYREWLKKGIKDYVLNVERREILENMDEQIRAKQEDVENALNL